MRSARWLLLVVLAGALAIWIGWVGYMASDDALYFDGAHRWLTDPPFPGDDHWSTRFPLTLTFAAVIAATGGGYPAFALTALLFYLGLVATMGWTAALVGGRRAGLIAALLTATLPVVVVHATTVSVDLAEATALLLGAMLLAGAGEDRRGLLRGVGAGVAFGVAVLCRETAVLALAAFGPLFLLGRPIPRRVLVACGVGLALVLGGEALFQYAMTGEPLRRYHIAFNHDSHIDRAANHEGNFLLWPPIDPLLVLLVNDDFGLLFWVAGAALVAGATRGLAGNAYRRLVVLGAMAGVSFLLVSLLYTKLVLNPRYFLLAALVAVIVVAIWLDRAAGRVRIALLVALVGSNLLLLAVGNAHPRWSMEVLLAAAASHGGEPVAGAPDDLRRGAQAAGFAGLTNLRALPAVPGGLAVVPADAPPSGAVVATYPAPPTRLGGLLRAVGAEPFVPAPVARRLFAPSPSMLLVRTPSTPPG